MPRAHLGGVTLPGFVQLLEAEKRTCALRVQSIEGAGTLVFDRGVIVDNEPSVGSRQLVSPPLGPLRV